MGSQQSQQQPTSQELPKTEDGVPIALLDLSKVKNFQDWLELVLAIENDNEDCQRQLKRIHECTLSFYLILKSMDLKDDGSTTALLIPKVAEFIQLLEESPMPELKTLVTWQGLSVDWLIYEFYQHPYVSEVCKFGCEAWHFRKWGVIVLIQWCQCKDLGSCGVIELIQQCTEWRSLSGPFLGHLCTVRHIWESTTTVGEMTLPRTQSLIFSRSKGTPTIFTLSPIFSQSKGTPTIFISYTGSYTVEHLVEALSQLSDSEFIWLDIFCVDQFAWTGKSRFPEMKEFKEIFVKDLQNQIGKIRHTALILQKWDDIMVTLKKMWVLWEIFNTANANAKLSVLLLPEQIMDFVQNCLFSDTKFDEIQKSLSKIDAGQAEAGDDGDRNAIYKEMNDSGFDEVNKRVAQVIREWQIRIGEDALEIEQEQGVDAHSLSLLNNLGRLNYIQGNNMKALSLLKKALGQTDELGKHHPATIATKNNLASVLGSQGQYEEAQQLLLQVLQQCQQELGENHPGTLMSMYNLAGVLTNQGQYQEAQQLLEQVLQQRQQVLGKNHPDTLMSMGSLASVLGYQGQYQEAQQLHQQVLQQEQQVLGKNHPDTLTSIDSLAGVLDSRGQYQEAEQLCQQVLRQRQQVLGINHPGTLSSINNQASVLRNQGQYEEAQQLYQLVLQQRQQVLGKNHPDTLKSMNNLAGVVQYRGQHQEAQELFKQVFQQRQQVLGKNHPDTLTSMNNLAFALNIQGQYEEAQQLFQHVLQQNQQVLGKNHPDTLTSMNNLAFGLNSQGRYKEAQQLFQHVLQQHQQVLGKNHPDTLTSMNNLASVLDSQGQYRKAQQLYQQVLQQCQQVLGKNHPVTLTSMNNLAFVLANQRRYQEAQELFLQVFHLRQQVLGKTHPDTLTSMNNLASVLANQRQNQEA